MSASSGGSSEETKGTGERRTNLDNSSGSRAHLEGHSHYEKRGFSTDRIESPAEANQSLGSGRRPPQAGKLPRYGAKLASKLSARSLLASATGSISLSSKETEVGLGPAAKESSPSPPPGKKGFEGVHRGGDPRLSSPGVLSSRPEYSGVGVSRNVGGRDGKDERNSDKDEMHEDGAGTAAEPVSVTQGLPEGFSRGDHIDGASSPAGSESLSGELRGLRMLQSTAGEPSPNSESGAQRERRGTKQRHWCTDSVSSPKGLGERNGDEGGDTVVPLKGQDEEGQHRKPPSFYGENHKAWRAEAARGGSNEAWSGGEENDRASLDSERLSLSLDKERLSLHHEEAKVLRDRLLRKLGSDRFDEACG